MLSVNKYRVVIADRRFQHPVGIHGVGRAAHIHTGKVREDRFGRVRMRCRCLIAPAARGSVDQGHLEHAIKEITHLSRVIGNRVERQKGKVDCHEFGDRAQAGHCRADRDAAYRHLADRCVAYAPLAKFVQKATCDTMRTLPVGHLFTHDKDVFITAHLFLQCPADSFPHGDISCCHRASLIWCESAK